MSTQLARRGTTNRNERGSSYTRRARREWMVETYRADQDVLKVTLPDGEVRMFPWPPKDTEPFEVPGAIVEVLPACRCYRCGSLLTAETLTVDRIVPGVNGGQYGTPTRDRREKRTNCRPACEGCNSSTGGALAKKARRRR